MIHILTRGLYGFGDKKVSCQLLGAQVREESELTV